MIRLYERNDVPYDQTLPRLGYIVDPLKRTEVIFHHTVTIDNDATPNLWETESEVFAKAVQMQTIRPDLGLDVPYNFLIFPMANGDLSVVEGRGMVRTGAHTRGHNTSGIGMGWVGDFRANLPPDMDSLMRGLAVWFKNRYLSAWPNIEEVHGHQDFKATTCPGRVYVYKDAFAQVLNEENPLAYLTIQQVQHALNLAGVTDFEGKVLKEDNDYGRRTESALVKAFKGGGPVGEHNHDTAYAKKSHGHNYAAKSHGHVGTVTETKEVTLQ